MVGQQSPCRFSSAQSGCAEHFGFTTVGKGEEVGVGFEVGLGIGFAVGLGVGFAVGRPVGLSVGEGSNPPCTGARLGFSVGSTGGGIDSPGASVSQQ